MVWGCISGYGMGSLHVLEGTMNRPVAGIKFEIELILCIKL